MSSSVVGVPPTTEQRSNNMYKKIFYNMSTKEILEKTEGRMYQLRMRIDEPTFNMQIFDFVNFIIIEEFKRDIKIELTIDDFEKLLKMHRDNKLRSVIAKAKFGKAYLSFLIRTFEDANIFAINVMLTFFEIEMQCIEDLICKKIDDINAEKLLKNRPTLH